MRQWAIDLRPDISPTQLLNGMFKAFVSNSDRQGDTRSYNQGPMFCAISSLRNLLWNSSLTTQLSHNSQSTHPSFLPACQSLAMAAEWQRNLSSFPELNSPVQARPPHALWIVGKDPRGFLCPAGPIIKRPCPTEKGVVWFQFHWSLKRPCSLEELWFRGQLGNRKQVELGWKQLSHIYRAVHRA